MRRESDRWTGLDIMNIAWLEFGAGECRKTLENLDTTAVKNVIMIRLITNAEDLINHNNSDLQMMSKDSSITA